MLVTYSLKDKRFEVHVLLLLETLVRLKSPETCCCTSCFGYFMAIRVAAHQARCCATGYVYTAQQVLMLGVYALTYLHCV